ncbi:hypothetical protein MP638_004111 [Amoeboaphelidium occidentale]|nr:hypothetical protein MP638_004111 [Amoeboaphelidium occidentale]
MKSSLSIPDLRSIQLNTSSDGTENEDYDSSELQHRISCIYKQLSQGCSQVGKCTHKLCASSRTFTLAKRDLDATALKMLSIQLASGQTWRRMMCPTIASEMYENQEIDADKDSEEKSPTEVPSGTEEVSESFLNRMLSSDAFKSFFTRQPSSRPSSRQKEQTAASWNNRSLVNQALASLGWDSPVSTAFNSPIQSPAASRPMSRSSSAAMLSDETFGFTVSEFRNLLNNVYESDDIDRGEVFQVLLRRIRLVFSSIDLLSESFLFDDFEDKTASRDDCLLGVSLEQVREFYDMIYRPDAGFDNSLSEMEIRTLKDSLTSSMEVLLNKLVTVSKKIRLDDMNVVSVEVKSFPNNVRDRAHSHSGVVSPALSMNLHNEIIKGKIKRATESSSSLPFGLSRSISDLAETHQPLPNVSKSVKYTTLKYLRALSVITEFPQLDVSLNYEGITKRLALCISRLHRSVKVHYAKNFAKAYLNNVLGFRRILFAFRKVICERYNANLISAMNTSEKPPSLKSEEDGVIASVRVLSFLLNVNEIAGKIRLLIVSSDDGSLQLDGYPLRTIVPFWMFYITSSPSFSTFDQDITESDSIILSQPVLKTLHMKQLYFDHLQATEKSRGELQFRFSLLNYPFLLDPVTKTRLIRIEAISWMSTEFEEAFVRQGFLGTLKRVVEGVQVNATSVQQSLSPNSSTSGNQAGLAAAAEETLDRLENAYSNHTNPYLVLEVNRNNLISSTLQQIQAKEKDLHKPLKIRFANEEGLDQGGVQKEFFQLVFEKLLSPDAGLFTSKSETGEDGFFAWPNAFSTEGPEYWTLVGVLIGLCIYNGIMADTKFPLVFFKKLLFENCAYYKSEDDFQQKLLDGFGDKKSESPDDFVTLDDLQQLYPQTARGLRQLLSWDAEENGGLSVEDVFCKSFEIAYEVEGTVRTYPLLKNGHSVDVTESNRDHYVRLYVRHILVDVLSRVFYPLKEGFWKVVGGPEYLKISSNSATASNLDSKTKYTSCMSLFRPEEVQILLTGLSSGSSSLYSAETFKVLKEITRYEDYTTESTIIQNFWSLVLNEFTDTQRKKLLLFVTASDRIPLGGFKVLKFVIQRNGGDVDRLPTALTCFSRLLLPEYASKQKLKQMVSLAVEESKGFGLI